MQGRSAAPPFFSYSWKTLVGGASRRPPPVPARVNIMPMGSFYAAAWLSRLTWSGHFNNVTHFIMLLQRKCQKCYKLWHHSRTFKSIFCHLRDWFLTDIGEIRSHIGKSRKKSLFLRSRKLKNRSPTPLCYLHGSVLQPALGNNKNIYW